MKINGHVCEKPKPEVLVIPRGDTRYVFHAQLLNTSNWDTFDKYYPKPSPPSKRTKDGISNNYDDKTYQEEMLDWTTARSNYMVIISLDATEDLEWDTVVLTDRGTWDNWTDDLLKSGFFDTEITALVNLVMDAQGLNASKMEQATKSFLAEQEAAL